MIIQDYIYCNVEINKINENLINYLTQMSNRNKQQIYILSSPLADRKYTYDYKQAMIIIATRKKIAFVNYGKNSEAFKNYYEDVIEDIASLSDRFGYKDKSVIGRPRDWREQCTKCFDIDSINGFEKWFTEDISLHKTIHRKQDLLISLFIGSINDVSCITNEEPSDLLEKVKHKIQLFDGQQTRFVYEELETEGKRITIQGLSGTGKTELLLHKLKELYVKHPQATIGFTCFNKILSNNLRIRIPSFFNFMKVEQQIDWERLLCVNAWGRLGNSSSGIYRYICDFYNIPFYSYKECHSFDVACRKAIDSIKKTDKTKGFAFTFIFIDESQDFKQSFFELCELVTEKKVFIAGDIFQSIFEERPKGSPAPNFLLSKCYRTDPKTLMFAQALGMGLFEKNKLWWLDDLEWELCGYKILKNGREYTLTREPLRRFEDIDDKFRSLEIIRTNNVLHEIVKQINFLREEFPSLMPGDIAVIFIDNHQYVYNYSIQLQHVISKQLNWDSNIAYETKKTTNDQVLISNRNNVKGLEYPFVFCITTKITKDPSYRNTMYTMLTRSFIRSYLMLPKEQDVGLTSEILLGGRQIMNEGKMVINSPSVDEIKKIKASIRSKKMALSLDERMTQIFAEKNIDNPDVQDFCRQTLSKLPVFPSDEKLVQLISTISSTFDQ